MVDNDSVKKLSVLFISVPTAALRNVDVSEQSAMGMRNSSQLYARFISINIRILYMVKMCLANLFIHG